MAAAQQTQDAQIIAEDYLNFQKYDKLISAIEDITQKKFPMCLLDITYCSTYEDEARRTNCSCGHQSLKYVNLMSASNGEEFVLGNICVGNLLLGLKEQDPEKLVYVITHIQTIYDKAETAIKELKQRKERENYLNCLRCKNKCINPNYNYKKEIRKHFCGDCIKGDKVICVECKCKTINFEKDYRGNYKILCYPCWKSKRN